MQYLRKTRKTSKTETERMSGAQSSTLVKHIDSRRLRTDLLLYRNKKLSYTSV